MIETKASLRRLKGLSLPEGQRRTELSARICGHLAHFEKIKLAKRLGVFAARPREPDLSEFATGRLLDVAFARVDGKTLKFFSVQKLTELTAGYAGILEPPEIPERRIEFAAGDVILVPGLRFDRHGARLGSGLGFYDRYLCGLAPGVITIGIAWSAQIIEGILPQEPHDVRMRYVCTEGGIVS